MCTFFQFLLLIVVVINSRGGVEGERRTVFEARLELAQLQEELFVFNFGARGRRNLLNDGWQLNTHFIFIVSS